MVKVYHYTSSKGIEGILETGKIYKSTRGARPGDDAAYGPGVYFTSMGPHFHTAQLVLNNYDGAVSDIKKLIRAKGDYVDCCLEFDSDEIESIERVGDVRDVWLYRGRDLFINNYKFAVYYRT